MGSLSVCVVGLMIQFCSLVACQVIVILKILFDLLSVYLVAPEILSEASVQFTQSKFVW